ncbi:hypothetical protein P879_04003 [Paragonimus westermani]|uniref:Uncharacterized protein n=1 Tax=Paragonimus westermani TaxID=34504 RepID=A0A8T0D5D6_9TREM|nr:hypothetical protein P879_04003 [Paragonimus westermani]
MDTSKRQHVAFCGKRKNVVHHGIIDHPNAPDCNMVVSRQTMVGPVSADDDIREKLNSIRSLAIDTHTLETSTTPLWVPDVTPNRKTLYSECASLVHGKNLHDVSSDSVCDHHTTKLTSERDLLLKNITHLLSTKTDATQDQAQRLITFENPVHLPSKPPGSRSEARTSLKQSSVDILARLQKIVTEAYEQTKHDKEFTVILNSLLNTKPEEDDTTLRQLDSRRWSSFDCRPFQGPKTPPSPNSRQRDCEFGRKRSHKLCERTILEQVDAGEHFPSTSKRTDSHRNRPDFAVPTSNIQEESPCMISRVNESNEIDLSRSRPIAHHCINVVHGHDSRAVHDICPHRGNANFHSSQSRLRMEDDASYVRQRPYCQRNGSKRNGHQNHYSGPPSPYAVACSYNADTVVSETPNSPPNVRTQTRLFQAPTTETSVHVDSSTNMVDVQDQWILAGLDLSTYNTDELRRLRNWITFSRNAGQVLATSNNLKTTREADQMADTFTGTDVSVITDLLQAQQKQHQQHDEPQTVKMQEEQLPVAVHSHLDTSQLVETGRSEFAVESRRRSVSSSSTSSSASTSSSSNTSTTGDSSGSANSSSTNESSYVSSTVSDRSRPRSATLGLVEPELKQPTYPYTLEIEGDGKCCPQVAPELVSCSAVRMEGESLLINPEQQKFLSDQTANDLPVRESSLHFDHLRTSPTIQVSLMENGRSPSTISENRTGGVTELIEDQENNEAQVPVVEKEGITNIPSTPKTKSVHNYQPAQSVCTSVDLKQNTLDSSICLNGEEILKSHSTLQGLIVSKRRDAERKHKEKSFEQVPQIEESDSKHFDMDTSDAHLRTAGEDEEEEEEEEGEVVSDCTSDVDDFQSVKTGNKHPASDDPTTSVPSGLEARSHGYIRSAAHKVIKKSSPTLRAAVSFIVSSPTRARESSEFKRPSTPKHYRKQLFDSQRTCRNTRFTYEHSTGRGRANRLWTNRVSYADSHSRIPGRSRRVWKESRMERDPKRLVSHRMYLFPQPVPRKRGRRIATDRDSVPLYHHSPKFDFHYKERLTTRPNTRPYSQGKGYGKRRVFDLRECKLNRTH